MQMSNSQTSNNYFKYLLLIMKGISSITRYFTQFWWGLYDRGGTRDNWDSIRGWNFSRAAEEFLDLFLSRGESSI